MLRYMTLALLPHALLVSVFALAKSLLLCLFLVVVGQCGVFTISYKTTYQHGLLP